MPASKVRLDCRYFATRCRENTLIPASPLEWGFPPSRWSRQWLHPIIVPLLFQIEHWCELEKYAPSSVHPKMVLFVGTSHFISICLKSMIVSIHNYDICDVNGAPRVVQYTTWATVYNDPTIHPQPSQAICSLDSVPAKPSGTKTERKRVVPEATPHLITDGILWGNRIKVLLETSQQMWLLLPSVHSKHPLLFLIFCCTPNSIRKAANFSPWGSFSTQAINA